MPTKAYILIETAVGKSRNVAGELRSLNGVETVDPVTGPYDIICVIETGSLDQLGAIVRDQVHAMEGVARTMSCMRLGE